MSCDFKIEQIVNKNKNVMFLNNLFLNRKFLKVYLVNIDSQRKTNLSWWWNVLDNTKCYQSFGKA